MDKSEYNLKIEELKTAMHAHDFEKAVDVADSLDIKKIRDNSTDNGPDPHKKDAEYICRVLPDWENGTLTWIPLCRHESDWLGQDAHPHPIYSHSGDRIFFNSRMDRKVNVYCVSAQAGK